MSADEAKDRPITLAAAAVWTVIALFLDLFLINMVEAAREGAFYDLVSRTACEALAYSLAFFGILRVHEPATSIRHVLGLKMPSPLAVLLGIALGAALSLPSEWLDQVVDARFPRPAAEMEALDRVLSVATVGKRVTLVVTLVVLQPVIDELFYRGALFTPLRRTYRVETVIVASAVLETLATLSPRAIPALFVATLVFAWMRAATGSIWPSLFARITYYGVAVVPIALGHDAPKPTKLLLFGSGAVAVVALLGLGWIARRRATLAMVATVDATRLP